MTHLEYSTVDTHTAGMPTRVVVDGLAHLGFALAPDADPQREASTDTESVRAQRTDTESVRAQRTDTESVRAQRDAFARDHDDVRRFLVCEPRGHDDMFGAVPVTPADPNADVGLFFMDTAGYLDMCGHATIGAITALVETGRLDGSGTVVVETPAGLVTTHPAIEDGRVVEVTFENVPSAFVETRTIHAGQYDMVDVDVVSAGNICALVEADDVGLSLTDTPPSRIAEVGLVLRDLLNEAGPVIDPITGRESSVSLVEFTETGTPNRTAVVFGDGAVDRSPCGTGTSARMTQHAHHGDLEPEASFEHVGPTGDAFAGRVIDATDDVYRTAVTGSAHITGRHTFLRAEADTLDPFTLE